MDFWKNFLYILSQYLKLANRVKMFQLLVQQLPVISELNNIWCTILRHENANYTENLASIKGCIQNNISM